METRMLKNDGAFALAVVKPVEVIVSGLLLGFTCLLPFLILLTSFRFFNSSNPMSIFTTLAVAQSLPLFLLQ